jgi:hypothetical protein
MRTVLPFYFGSTVPGKIKKVKLGGREGARDKRFSGFSTSKI